MEISNNIYSPKFTARNPEIRLADDIARRVNKCYPRISSTIFSDFNNIKKLPCLYEKLQNDTDNFRELVYLNFGKERSVSKHLKFFTKLIEKKKLGNCREASELALLAARLNLNKPCCFAGLYHPNGFDYDHAVVLCKNNGKPFVIDAWLGFADYLPKAVKRYQNEFGFHFDFESVPDNKMKIFPENDFAAKLVENISSDKKLKKMFPQLVIKKDPQKTGLSKSLFIQWSKFRTLLRNNSFFD